jgi:hypothetical protein
MDHLGLSSGLGRRGELPCGDIESKQDSSPPSQHWARSALELPAS